MTKLEQQREWENRINLYRASGRKQWCASNNVRDQGSKGTVLLVASSRTLC